MTDPLSTPKKQSSSAYSSRPSNENSSSLRKRLEIYRVFVHVIDPFKDHQVIADYTEDILNGDRASPGLSVDMQDTFMKRIEAISNGKNEDELCDALVPLLFQSPQYLGGMPHLGRSHNRIFVANCIPLPGNEDEKKDAALQALMAKVKFPSTPKPDFAFGADDEAFNEAETRINLIYDSLAGVSMGIQHPFMVVEVKSMATGGKHYEAQTQAARSGAALVHARMQLNEQAPDYDSSVPPCPTKSCAFSCTMDTQSAWVWAHWCDIDPKDGRKSFHMGVMSQHFLNMRQSVKELRRKLDNIIDWGMGRRLIETKSLLHKLDAKLRKHEKGSNKRQKVS
ncbi:hypothetical protein MMC06_006284 [Schaereria dolodes]|nr:hypothetical protein [Schaereria dolodes]